MSSERGNVTRKRSQKHQNSHRFKNDLHDKTPKTKFLNNLELSDVCLRCKSLLEWKIKYKKYKLIKNPRTCTKCGQKNVNLSYRIMCAGCSNKLNVCPKCGLEETESNLLPKKHGNFENEQEDSSESEESVK